jgi:predicted nucleotidyltransferase component of viral defense system
MKNNILTPKQAAFLKAFGESALAKNFYLSGGTPLSAFYLKHRYSEDLDFFCENEFDTLSIDIFFKKVKDKLGITKIDFQQSYNRNLFFCQFKNEILKTEFTYFPFPRLEKGSVFEGVEIDSLTDIAVNKLFTIYQRTKARDYIDLFFVVKEAGFSIEELIHKARSKFDWHIDPIQLGTQFIKVKEAKDYPRMIKHFDKKTLIDFFITEAKRFKTEILE